MDVRSLCAGAKVLEIMDWEGPRPSLKVKWQVRRFISSDKQFKLVQPRKSDLNTLLTTETINHTYPELWAYTGKHNTETNLDIIWKQIHG